MKQKPKLIDPTNNNKLDLKLILQTMFTNPAFQRLAVNETRPNELYFGHLDGLKIGAAAIFPSRSGDDCALSEPVLKRLLDGKRSGKIDHAYVVQAERGAQKIFVDCIDAEELQRKLSSLPPVIGVYGPYWWVPRHFKFDVIASADEPF
jgi:hypothetical protein